MTDKEILLEFIFIEHPDIWALKDMFDYERGVFRVKDGFSYINKLLNKKKQILLKYVKEFDPGIEELKIETDK